MHRDPTASVSNVIPEQVSEMDDQSGSIGPMKVLKGHSNGWKA